MNSDFWRVMDTSYWVFGPNRRQIGAIGLTLIGGFKTVNRSHNVVV